MHQFNFTYYIDDDLYLFLIKACYLIYNRSHLDVESRKSIKLASICFNLERQLVVKLNSGLFSEQNCYKTARGPRNIFHCVSLNINHSL